MASTSSADAGPPASPSSPGGEPLVGFEGPEKNLEIDFVPSKGPKEGMRGISKDQWQKILDEAKCSILGEIQDDACTAYLLSESSLFVYSHKIIAKTCGTTTLLRMLPPLLERVAARGMEVEWVAYSRKDFLFPQEQVFPHRSTTEEISFLQRYFPTGSAHVLGPLTSDHWVVFVADYCERPPTESTDVTLDIKMFDICDGMSHLLHGDKAQADAERAGVRLEASDGAEGTAEDEEAKLEMEEAAAKEAAADAKEGDSPAAGAGAVDLERLAACPGPSSAIASFVTRRSGLSALLPGSTVHAFMFEPCGYSANGLLDGSYWTVHVTPEKHCSYASFETNVRPGSLRPLVRAVLALFRPKRFTLTLFADAQGVKEMPDLPVEPYLDCGEQLAAEGGRQAAAGLGPLSTSEDPRKWKLTDKSHTEFAGDYCVVLANYRDVRSPPSRALSPAVRASAGAGALAAEEGEEGGADGESSTAAIVAAAGLSQGTGAQAVPKAGEAAPGAGGKAGSGGGAGPVDRAVGEGVALPQHVSMPHGGPAGGGGGS